MVFLRKHTDNNQIYDSNYTFVFYAVVLGVQPLNFEIRTASGIFLSQIHQLGLGFAAQREKSTLPAPEGKPEVERPSGRSLAGCHVVFLH